MQGKYIVALDQGTTSSRTVVLDQDVNIVAVVHASSPRSTPVRAGWSMIPARSGPPRAPR